MLKRRFRTHLIERPDRLELFEQYIMKDEMHQVLAVVFGLIASVFHRRICWSVHPYRVAREDCSFSIMYHIVPAVLPQCMEFAIPNLEGHHLGSTIIFSQDVSETVRSSTAMLSAYPMIESVSIPHASKTMICQIMHT